MDVSNPNLNLTKPFAPSRASTVRWPASFKPPLSTNAVRREPVAQNMACKAAYMTAYLAARVQMEGSCDAVVVGTAADSATILGEGSEFSWFSVRVRATMQGTVRARV